MSDMLGISSNAIGVYQRALSTVSNNIANVNTEGYSRQDVVIKDSAPKKLASMYVGTGAVLQKIRRQYDEFAESNLRNSNTDLNAQKPMVDYTKRVMDILGDKSIGLSSALDDFFNTAGSLSADPASTVLRTSFLRSADGVASRFAELSGQLDLIKTETQDGLKSVADKINTLTSQLALINQSMSRASTLDEQPAELLDRRDLTLRQLSELVRTKISFATNGSVKVSLGTTMTQGVVVDGQKSRPIGLDPTGKNTQDLILDPYGQSEPLSTLSGGQMGGYQTFLAQVLEPAQKNLNALAVTFVNETNAIQANGIDAYGQIGQKLFALSPAAPQEAAGIQLAIADGKRVATAAQFRVSEGNTNVTTTRATVKFDGRQTVDPLSNKHLVNNPHPSSGVTFKVEGNREYAAVTSLAAGVKATFYLDEMEPGQNLQVLTKDGRQLLGQPLTETQKYQILQPSNGFEQNATYSDQYLNQIDPKAYRDLDYFYGAKGEILYKQNFDINGAQGPGIAMPASMETARIDSVNFQIPAQALMLNNVALQRFVPLQGTEVMMQNLVLGTPACDFKFSAVLDNRQISVTVPALQAASMDDLVAELDLQLQSYGLNVTLAHNDQDIVLGDSQGRSMSGVSLVPVNSTTAKQANVSVSSAASQMADWINGSTKLEIVAPNFSAISLKLGGIAYQMTGLDPTHPDQLAADLQANMRQFFRDQDISVDLESDRLVLTDKQGRELTGLVLTPGVTGANPGITKITQSTVSQTQVRAEVFSELRVPVSQLQFDKPLTLNGRSITGFTTTEGLADAINAAGVGLDASLTTDGVLLIENKQGSPIDVGISINGNALNVNAGSYGGQVRMTQIYRDYRVSAATIDLNQPLAMNGQVLNEVTYDAPASLTNYAITATLPALSLSASSAAGLATALNGVTDFAKEFKATVDGNRLVIRPLNPGLTDEDLAKRFNITLGAQNLVPQNTLKSIDDLVARIDARQSETGVIAKRDINGDLILCTTDKFGRGEISIGPGKDSTDNYIPNMLGIEPLDYNVTRRLQAKLLDENFTVDPYQTDIRLTFGTYVEGNPPTTHYGDPSQLAKLGLRTAAYIETASPDDLMVFVTGKGQANVAVGYSGEPANNRDLLRSQSLLVKFTAADRYSIIDATTGAELADRLFDPTAFEPQIEFQGLTLSLSTAPKVGDAFKIDGNFDGLGNNVNILEMVSLNKKPLDDGKTLHETYIDQVNNIGNLSQQALITQEALTVVNEQAVQSRDKVSGVNMDEEAAALVRYQQAYQAAAKAMQVAGQLFDSIIQIK